MQWIRRTVSVLLRREFEFYYGFAMGGAIAGSGTLIWGFKLGHEYEHRAAMERESYLQDKNDKLSSSLFGSMVAKKEGWLEVRKRGKIMSGVWRQRLCSLKENFLSIQKVEGESYPIVETSIVLDDFTLSEVKDLITRKNCFDLHNHLDNTTHQFCSESAEVALEWLKALKQAAEIKNKKIITVEIPSMWTPPINKYQTVDIPEGSIEWKMCENMMQSTISTHKRGNFKGYKIRSVKRVQNPVLWKRYALTREEIATETGGHPNERWLFHGTRPSNVHKIIHEGFDHRVSNDYGMFGSGIYFAENSSKSHDYTGTLLNGQRQMLLCRVVLGNEYISAFSRQAKRPPNGSWLDGYKKYHSVVGDSQKYNPRATLNNREFVIYDNTQAYPEYIIQYSLT